MKKNQQTQIIVLSCLMVVILGLGVFKVMGGSRKPSPAPQKPAVETKEVAQAPTDRGQPTPEQPQAASEAPAQSVQEAASPVSEVNLGAIYKARDPFIPQVLDPVHDIGSQRSRSAPLVSRMPKLPLPLISPLRPQPINIKPIPTLTPSEPEPDPASVLQLTGVIEGNVNVAIIRGEGGARYIVREGQSIEGKYVVQSISRNGVRLKCGNRAYILRLGASQASK